MKARMLNLEKFAHITQYAVYTYPIDCGFIMPISSEKAQTEMQICPWTLVWAFLGDYKVNG